MQRFLVIQTAFLGDVILATPIISELKRIYPDSEIDVVVRKGSESLLSNNPKINRVIIWDKRKKKYLNLCKTIREIRKNKYTEVITLQRYANAGLMTLFAKAKSKIGFDKNALSWVYTQTIPHSLTDGTHEVERNLRLIQHHGAQALIRPELFPSAADFEYIQQFKKSELYYCIAPSSVVQAKQLPIEKWQELLPFLVNEGEVFLLGSKEDVALCNRLTQQFPAKVFNLAGKLSLLQSAALMKDAKMNFVNDSSPLHLASAMNAPTRAFFTSTIPLYGFGPLADDSKVIEPKNKLDASMTTPRGIKKPINGIVNFGHEIDISPENLEIEP